MFYSVYCHFQEFPNLKNISAETYIPEARKIDKLEVVKLDKKGEEQGLELNLEFRFTLDPKHTYYEISAYVFDEFSQDFQKFPVDLNLKKFEKGIFKVDSRKSLFINTDIVNDQFIYATVDTYLPERLIASLDKIYFKLSTINKEHYMFQQNFVRRQESSQAPLSEPVIFYSNIDNGLGLLTGYSSNIDSLSIK